MFGTAATGDTVSSLTSQDSSCITQMELGCVGHKATATLISVYREQMVMSVHLASYGLDFTMMANMSWLCWMAPRTTKYTGVCCNKVSYLWHEPPSRTIVYLSKRILHPTKPGSLGKSWISHPKVQIWTPPLEPDDGSYPYMNDPQKTAARLCVAVQKLWVALTPVKLRTLVHSMPCWVHNVLAAHGGHIHW